MTCETNGIRCFDSGAAKQVKNGEKPEEKHATANCAFHRKRRNALDLAKHEPESKNKQPNRKDIRAPSK